MSTPSAFSPFGLRRELLVRLAELGLTQPTPIQVVALPPILAGKDVLVQAETGSGKTLAYGLPLLNGIAAEAELPRMLVVVPTRELALQVRDVLRDVSRKWRPMVHALVGGERIEPQIRSLEKGCAVAVGTPGRLTDLLRRGALQLKRLESVVLDEADELLLGGFLTDLEAILSAAGPHRQTVLVSATMRDEVREFANRVLKDPVSVGLSVAEAPATLEHRWLPAPREGKPELLIRLLRAHPGRAIVFVRLKEETKRLSDRLRRAGLSASFLSSEASQENRHETLRRFREGLSQVLVATDVAARGLDVPEVDLVVHYSVPVNVEQYLHRSGRAARAGRTGMAVTLSYREEADALKALRREVTLEPLELAHEKRRPGSRNR